MKINQNLETAKSENPSIPNEMKINLEIIHNTILPEKKLTDHKSTNSKTRTNQIIQNQNKLHYFPREIPQHQKDFPNKYPINSNEAKSGMEVGFAAIF